MTDLPEFGEYLRAVRKINQSWFADGSMAQGYIILFYLKKVQ